LFPSWPALRARSGSFGSQGLEALWDEVAGWTRASEKFFRNYSVRQGPGKVKVTVGD
jgi:hypothetical protein